MAIIARQFVNNLKERLDNQAWVARCLLDDNPSAFPYRPSAKGKSTIAPQHYYPNQLPQAQPQPEDNCYPNYLINIPLVHPFNANCDTSLKRILNMLKTQSFGTTPQESNEEVKKRLAVVIGINRIQSIDSNKNRDFEHDIHTLSNTQEIAYRTFGFLWKPDWDQIQTGVYDLEKAFLLLRTIDPEKAEKIRKVLEDQGALFEALKRQILDQPKWNSSDAFPEIARQVQDICTLLSQKSLKNSETLREQIQVIQELHNSSINITQHINDLRRFPKDKDIEQLRQDSAEVTKQIQGMRELFKQTLEPNSGVKKKQFSPKDEQTLLKNSKAIAEQVKSLQEFLKQKLLESELLKNSQAIRAQIPYKDIREEIKNHRGTQEFLKIFSDASQENPIYFGTMDSDLIKMRLQDEGNGLLTRYDDVALDHYLPSVMSLGYTIVDDERPVIDLGVRIDMAVREAMKGFCYFPEPSFLALVREPYQANILSKLSFKRGTGNTLESRRFITGGIDNGFLDPRNVVLIADGGVAMGAPGRMLTKKNSRIENLTPEKLKQKQTLKALRHVSQSHAKPKHWADNIYPYLPITASTVTDVTTPMMYIFKVFDPISLAFKINPRYSPASFDWVMENYEDYVKVILDPTANLDDYPILKAKETFIRERISLLEEQREELIGLKLPDDWVDKITRRAAASGAAIHRILKDQTE